MKYFIPTLTLIFVVAKILGYISWSWWVVFSPVLAVLGLAASFFLVLFIIYLKTGENLWD